MRDPWEEGELARRFRENSASSHPRAPLYAALSAGISRDRQLFGLLLHAPPEQRLPVLLFASVHALLLDDSSHRLTEWYPNLTETPRSPADDALLPTFKEFVIDRSPALIELIASRSTQTNEVGRCALLLPALGRLGDEVGPLAHIDVGCSGGLTLFHDRFAYQYEPDGGDPSVITEIGPRSPVTLHASTRGDLRLPQRIPEIAGRVGLDRAPIDVSVPAEARWLEACVWPDQPDRFRRLRAAIEIAVQEPARLVSGDAVTNLAGTIASVDHSGHPVVTNTWVLNYLNPDARSAYVEEVDRIGAERDLSWIYAESPALTPELPWATELADLHLTITTLATWRDGERTVEHLFSSHPHGYWIHAL